jgi:hypothetical protein
LSLTAGRDSCSSRLDSYPLQNIRSRPVVKLTKAVTDPDRAADKRVFDAMMQMNKIVIATTEAAFRNDV